MVRAEGIEPSRANAQRISVPASSRHLVKFEAGGVKDPDGYFPILDLTRILEGATIMPSSSRRVRESIYEGLGRPRVRNGLYQA